MSLYSYLARLEDTLRSRQDITLEDLQLTLTTIGAIVRADIRFYDGSRLSMVEKVEKLRLFTPLDASRQLRKTSEEDVLWSEAII